MGARLVLCRRDLARVQPVDRPSAHFALTRPQVTTSFWPVFGLTDVESSTADLAFRHGAILACSFGIEVLKRANTGSEEKEKILGQFLNSFAFVGSQLEPTSETSLLDLALYDMYSRP